MSDSSWKNLYTAALTESDPKKLNLKIELAQRAIHKRQEELHDSDSRERDQLDRALHALFTLAARKRSA
jgi:hypothetical protein